MFVGPLVRRADFAAADRQAAGLGVEAATLRPVKRLIRELAAEVLATRYTSEQARHEPPLDVVTHSTWSPLDVVAWSPLDGVCFPLAFEFLCPFPNSPPPPAYALVATLANYVCLIFWCGAAGAAGAGGGGLTGRPNTPGGQA